MDFTGIDVSKAISGAKTEAAKMLETRLKDWLKVKMTERHNLRVRAAKFRADAASHDAKADEIDRLLVAIESGDYTRIEPIEMGAKEKDTKDEPTR